jgi:large subunit ribosomal protein L21
MYAVIEDGGKQYKVGEGETVELEKKDLQPGASVEFDRVLLVSKEGDVRVGAPVVAGAKVTGTVVDTVKGEKLTVLRYRDKRGLTVKHGHRQRHTLVRIDKIEFPA